MTGPKPPRAALAFPVREPTDCPRCKTKTVHHLKDGSSYCAISTCSWTSEVDVPETL